MQTTHAPVNRENDPAAVPQALNSAAGRFPRAAKLQGFAARFFAPPGGGGAGTPGQAMPPAPATKSEAEHKKMKGIAGFGQAPGPACAYIGRSRRGR